MNKILMTFFLLSQTYSLAQAHNVVGGLAPVLVKKVTVYKNMMPQVMAQTQGQIQKQDNTQQRQGWAQTQGQSSAQAQTQTPAMEQGLDHHQGQHQDQGQDQSQDEVQSYAILKVQVPSHGCTKAQDFEASLEKEQSVQKLVINRMRIDTCQGHIMGGEPIKIRVEGVDGDLPLEVVNPLLYEVKEVH